MKNALLIFLVLMGLCSLSYAQVLDDDMIETQSAESQEDEDEELFNELFSDYPETERDISKVKTFDDAMDQAVGLIKDSGTDITKSEDREELPPLEGDLEIGVTSGSFRIFQDAMKSTVCTFSVTLKSNLNRLSHVIALNLIYPHRTFAFVYRDVPANGTQVEYIRTRGDICYNLAGVPDISVHKCKIVGMTGNECAARIKWNDNLTAPKIENEDY